MGLFGAGSGDRPKDSRDPLFGDIARDLSRPASDAQANGVAAVIVFAVGVLVLGKYIPLLFGGAALGLVLYFARFQLRRADWVRVYLGAALFFAAVCFVLVGSPLEKGRSDYVGLLWPLPEFKQFLRYLMGQWNGFFPSAKYFQRFWITEVSLSQTALYVWGTWACGIAFSGLFLGIAAWRKSTPASSIVKRAVAGFPSWWFGVVLSPILGGWVRKGYKVSRGGGLGHGLALGLMSGGLSYVFYRFACPWIGFRDLRRFAELAAFLPFAGAALGFALGRVAYGREIFRALFGADPPKPDPKPGNGDRFLLGYTFQGYPFELTERNLAYHVEIVTPSGGGKTNLLKNLLSDRIRRGHGVFFLDLKGEFDVAAWMYRAAKSVGREGEVRLLSLANRELSVPYNPIKRGSAPEIHSQIMSALTWTEDYYRKISSIALMTLVRGLTEYRDRTGEFFHLGHLYELLDRPGQLRAFNARLSALGAPSARDVELLAERLDRASERKELSGLIAGLNQLLYSSAGPLMSEDVVRGSYDLKEAIDEGRITYFLMNSLMLKESAAVFGKMILQDLMGFVGNRYAEIERGRPPRPITLIVDEFANFATPEFIDFLDRARGAGIGVVMAHQARADLRKISPEFQERVEANSNTTIVSGIKSSQDAEYYAGMVGTRTTEKETRQVERGFLWDNDTGMKSIREVEEYIVHPNELKRLDQGEAFAISRTVDPHWALVRVPQAAEFRELAIGAPELKAHFQAIRSRYLSGASERYLDLSTLAQATPMVKAHEEVRSIPAPEQTAVSSEKPPSVGPPPGVGGREPELWS